MDVSKRIDWISVTLPADAVWRNFIPFADIQPNGKGRHGYRHAWIDKQTGARIESDSDRREMGTHLTLSGDVLESMRNDLGAVDDKIVERITQWDGSVSRIDLAIDIHGGFLQPSDLDTALKDGSASVRARTWRFIDGHKNGIDGTTLDTGSPLSDVRLRYYDKRAERGIKDGEAWTRLELQLRRLYAKSAIQQIADTGSSGVISASIGAYLKWSAPEYNAAIADSTGAIRPISRTEGNRAKWLLGQVAKALACEMIDDPTILRKFQVAVNFFYEQRNAEIDNQNKRAHNDSQS